ncbi:c2 domain-containing protein-like [Anaeramoeba flamelloides]|uniref:C2 domain-containing protein-like n=1 Tax=Anaeramoeba flamelloides TaxID=1746091 RepID=A0AAV8AC52_9EUKA|nr:c2 domain-containing protein-like [Anaeramoeba flamelloides]
MEVPDLFNLKNQSKPPIFLFIKFFVLVFLSYLCGHYRSFSLLLLLLLWVSVWILHSRSIPQEQFSINDALPELMQSRESETIDWGNKLLTQLWAQWFTPELTEYCRKAAEESLNTSSSMFETAQVPSLFLGSTAPMLTSIKELPREKGSYQLPLTADVIYFGQFSTTLKIKFKGTMPNPTVKVSASDLILMGTVRILISFLPSPQDISPCISNIAITFESIPKVTSLNVRALGGLQLNSLPGIRSWLLRNAERGLSFITTPNYIIWEWITDRWLFWEKLKVPIDLGLFDLDENQIKEFEIQQEKLRIKYRQDTENIRQQTKRLKQKIEPNHNEDNLEKEAIQEVHEEEQEDEIEIEIINESEYEDYKKENNINNSNSPIEKQTGKKMNLNIISNYLENSTKNNENENENESNDHINSSTGVNNQNTDEPTQENKNIENSKLQSKQGTRKSRDNSQGTLSERISTLKVHATERIVELNSLIERLKIISNTLSDQEYSIDEYPKIYSEQSVLKKRYVKRFYSVILQTKNILLEFKQLITNKSLTHKKKNLRKLYRSEYSTLIQNIKVLENSQKFLVRRINSLDPEKRSRKVNSQQVFQNYFF